ncbi:MAG TPA: adenylyltransferase/cytidyltransferase family protein [Bacteroidales bacterium]|jgi:cytidyltransferase-like protein|nr:adenylyltransferase/cytidyltransferase family protein [Bacteroidales bacterium]HNR42446.1 adenylyltransferase/cytidyltransferase family protein [Bacteroidales bacterium]HPM18387.1 adenylyltransferase/cytidyltransferase family protein [Bacteroidales bacterium]HQG78574.1 adenylyltransferase/cytidyltransferase family protein [Bacteroidales bacterium]
MSIKKKVLVSGCFDMLHSGHIAFLQEASEYGELYIGLGSDKTIRELKGRETVNSEAERVYILSALSCVHKAFVNKGSGLLDFAEDLKELSPDIFIVNEDGHSPEKEKLCRDHGIEYKVLKRIPHGNLPARSTTALRTIQPMPYRIDLAGTWIDQPYVSKYHPGAAITASLEPTIEFNERSGMATSTRKKAIELWNYHLPLEKPEKLARLLFRYDNDPGTTEVSGSQDSIGITMPGITWFYYDRGEYWPSKFETISDLNTIKWLEDRLYMLTLWPRPNGYNVLSDTNINAENVKRLADAAGLAWEGLVSRDFGRFTKGFLESFRSQVRMFPKMMNADIQRVIDQYRETASAWKLSGAGGGGYLILISEQEIPNAFRIKIRMKDFGM